MHPHARKATRKPSTRKTGNHAPKPQQRATDAPQAQTGDFWKDYDKWWREVLKQSDRVCAEMARHLKPSATAPGIQANARDYAACPIQLTARDLARGAHEGKCVWDKAQRGW